LRGVNIERLCRQQPVALKPVEDVTEFEHRAAYFDGDPVIATKKGVNVLDRGSQVHDMAEVQELLDFPPAPKLDVFGRLDPSKASEAELRGQAVFFGKGQCGFVTRRLLHRQSDAQSGADSSTAGADQRRNGERRRTDQDLPVARDKGLAALSSTAADARDTVEFFNLLLADKLTAADKQDLVAFLRALIA
jgi:cytochrome c peroxidase